MTTKKKDINACLNAKMNEEKTKQGFAVPILKLLRKAHPYTLTYAHIYTNTQIELLQV